MGVMTFPIVVKATRECGRGLETPSVSHDRLAPQRWSGRADWASRGELSRYRRFFASGFLKHRGDVCEMPLWPTAPPGIHGPFLRDPNRGAQRQSGTAARHVRLVVEGAEHLGRGEAGGGGGPQPGGPAQLHTPGPGPASGRGEGHRGPLADAGCCDLCCSSGDVTWQEALINTNILFQSASHPSPVQRSCFIYGIKGLNSCQKCPLCSMLMLKITLSYYHS